MLSKEELQQGLSTHIVGRKLFVFASIDSTNACAKTLADAGTEEGAVVVADFQTAGQGRQGRSWQSEPGANLLFSCILRPQLPQEQAGLLTFYASVAVARALEAVAGTTIECKWPNDVLLNGKKCCGILLENSFVGGAISSSILGIGVNINQLHFPPDLEKRATSLRRELGMEFNRNHILQAILGELDALLPEVKQGAFERILSEWNARCTMFGKSITIANHDSTFVGTALRLHTDGGLVVDTAEGRRIVYSGDITVSSH
jgi:BirA family biotin operon repressor/biotin-[acetyl-CoA-carboxylase] ligase